MSGRRLLHSPWRPTAIVAALFACCQLAHGATSNDPLNPLPGKTNEVLYYYDYADDGTTSGQYIHDQSERFNDADSRGSLTDFVFNAGAGLNFLLPGARVWDVNASGNGAITLNADILGHQDISDYGGYTFETYLRRTGTTASEIQNIWNPEGMHSIEILPNGFNPAAPNLQFAIRGLNSFTVPVNGILPPNEWHHIMAVMKVTQPLPLGGDPTVDPLLATYELFIDGVSVNAGTTGPPNNFPINPLPPGGSQDLNNSTNPTPTLETSPNPFHGIGWQEFGNPPDTMRHFLGEMAMTRLTLGALTPQQSLFNFVEDADFNDNARVEGTDFLHWQRGFGKAAGAVNGDGDANLDGKVNAADFAIWKSKFGGPAAAASQNAVPEPTAVAAILSMLAAIAARRRAWRQLLPTM